MIVIWRIRRKPGRRLLKTVLTWVMSKLTLISIKSGGSPVLLASLTVVTALLLLTRTLVLTLVRRLTVTVRSTFQFLDGRFGRRRFRG